MLFWVKCYISSANRQSVSQWTASKKNCDLSSLIWQMAVLVKQVVWQILSFGFDAVCPDQLNRVIKKAEKLHR